MRFKVERIARGLADSLSALALRFLLCACAASLSCAPARFSDLRLVDQAGKKLKVALSAEGREKGAESGDALREGDRFAFPSLPPCRAGTSLVIEYRSEGASEARAVLETQGVGGDRASGEWRLPASNKPLSLQLPVAEGRRPLGIGFSLGAGTGGLRLEGLRLEEGGPFYGFDSAGARVRMGPGFSLSPNPGGGRRLSLSAAGLDGGLYVLSIGYRSESARAVLSGLKARTELLPGRGAYPVSIPFRAANRADLNLDAAAGFEVDSFRILSPGEGPIPSDPLRIVDWPRADFRRPGYELFRWDAFPDVLVFLFADYGEQDDMLKRLAFYAEKAGFRGRLAGDAEIAGLHGWNAHDYPASKLAAFYSLAEETGFPLGKRELELEGILAENGIIRKKGRIWSAGKGAIISISLQSSRDLRLRFMAHEGYHGIFFTDPGFKEAVRPIWEGVSPELRRYILDFFAFKELDVSDPELMLNEFASYFLQTPSYLTPAYFSGTVADLLEADKKGGGEYRRFAKAREPEFLSLARALEAVARRSYGLSGGRVWRTE